MLYTPKIQKAIQLATQTHEIDQKQKRKGRDIPYIVHPLTVALILSCAGASEDVITAGILHDAIEDSIAEKKVTVDMVREIFGENVASLVLSVTEQDKSLSWEVRKAEALGHIKTFSHDSVLVKSADLIANVSDTIADYQREGEAIFAKFNAPKEKTIKSRVDTITALLARWPESPLAEDLKGLLEGIQKMI